MEKVREKAGINSLFGTILISRFSQKFALKAID